MTRLELCLSSKAKSHPKSLSFSQMKSQARNGPMSSCVTSWLLTCLTPIGKFVMVLPWVYEKSCVSMVRALGGSLVKHGVPTICSTEGGLMTWHVACFVFLC